MADTKKEWKHLTFFEKFIRFFVNSVGILIAAFVTYFAYCVPVECTGLDQGVNIYCLTHPGSAADAIGFTLLWFGAFWLSGVWAPLLSWLSNVWGAFNFDDGEDVWKRITLFAWLASIAGPAIITLW